MTSLLALDLGTGSCRAVLFDADGHQLAVGQREWSHASLPGVPGSQVFDTGRNWQLIGACVRDALASSGLEAGEIAAVSTTSMREGMVLYDEQGSEIWACPNVDSRAADEADELVRSGVARQLFETGGDWVPITAPARLRWIQRHQPEVFNAVAHLGMLSDWALYRLCGRFVTDPSAGSSSDLFDLRARTWSPELLDLVGLGEAVVPEVVEPGTVIGQVHERAAAETGLAAGTPVVVGGADTQLGLVGIGVTQPGRLTLVSGSFWQLTAVTDVPLIDPQARVRTLCHAVPGHWMTEGIGFYCGIAMRWFRDAFCELETAEAARRGVDPYLVMEEVAAGVPAGANGVLAIFSNVMNVKRWVQATPSFLQFDVDQPAASNRAACIRALEEQAAFASRGHLDILRELTGADITEILMTGGAAKGSLWPQIVADALGVTVHIPEVKESTALGAAIFAGIGIGAYPDLATATDRLVRIERTVKPDATTRPIYDDHFARWRETYARVLELSESGLLRPMWWPAGANAVEPA
ncbi:MAG TPA: autoinducer-2 kinase [Candidatus Limnocylindria bacterium]